MEPQYEPAPDEGPLFSRRQLGIMASGGTFLLAGAAGALAWARSDTGTRGRPTSFGTVEIRQAERRPRLAPLAGASDSAGLAGGHHHGSGTSRKPGNHTWADVVLLELEVRNLQDIPILLSPGQLRLKVGADGMGVTPNGAARQAGPIGARATERFAISYLAPSDTNKFSAEFSDPWDQRAVALELPAVRQMSAMEARL